MMEISFSASFKRAFHQRIAGQTRLATRFWERVDIFLRNPHDARLRTHKLSGALREMRSFTIEHDVRLVFFFSGTDRAVFIDIGKRDEVY